MDASENREVLLAGGILAKDGSVGFSKLHVDFEWLTSFHISITPNSQTPRSLRKKILSSQMRSID